MGTQQTKAEDDKDISALQRSLGLLVVVTLSMVHRSFFSPHCSQGTASWDFVEKL